MPQDEAKRLGLAEKDQALMMTLMAMDSGEAFWYSREEMKALIAAVYQSEPTDLGQS